MQHGQHHTCESAALRSYVHHCTSGVDSSSPSGVRVGIHAGLEPDVSYGLLLLPAWSDIEFAVLLLACSPGRELLLHLPALEVKSTYATTPAEAEAGGGGRALARRTRVLQCAWLGRLASALPNDMHCPGDGFAATRL